jgi:hypothetical protein
MHFSHYVIASLLCLAPLDIAAAICIAARNAALSNLRFAALPIRSAVPSICVIARSAERRKVPFYNANAVTKRVKSGFIQQWTSMPISAMFTERCGGEGMFPSSSFAEQF